MTRSMTQAWLVCCLATFALASCASDTTSTESTGALSLALEIDSGVEINEVDWTITSPGMDPMSGTINTSAPGSTASVEVFGLPPGDDYNVELEAMGEDGTNCRGDADFEVEVGETEFVMVYLNCKRPETLGAVRVNGDFNICAELAKVIVSPLQTSLGNDIDLSAVAQDVDSGSIDYLWTGTGGSIDNASATETTYTCEELGDQIITITVSDDDFDYCMHSWAVDVTCVVGDGPDCVGDDDCDDGFVCEDFECVPDVECTNDDDCDAGFVCEEFECVPDVECTNDDDCDAGFVCENFECVPDVECNEDDDCGLDQVCIANACYGDPDLFCNENLCDIDDDARADCIQTFILCVEGEPADEEGCAVLARLKCNECNEDSDCEPGEVCTDDKVCEGAGEIALPMVVDDNYFGRSGFSDGEGGAPLHTEDNDCPQRAGDEAGVCHRFTWDGTGANFTGTFWTDGEGFVDLNGLPVEGGATEVSFWAWGAAGGEFIEFGAGLGESQWDGAQIRIFRTLTTTPTRYSVPLDNLAGYTEVFGPFIWAATSSGNPSGVEFYVDDIQWIQAAPVPLGPIDFEPDGLGAEFTWAVFENVDNPPLEFISNPDQTGANTSSTVAKFTARQAGAPFAGTITLDLPTFTLNASNSCVKMKVWKSVVSDVGIKFENANFGSTGEILVANTVTEEWEELAFDFSGVVSNPENTDITGLVVFPDFDARTQENVIYFDDIVFLDGGQCP